MVRLYIPLSGFGHNRTHLLFRPAAINASTLVRHQHCPILTIAVDVDIPVVNFAARRFGGGISFNHTLIVRQRCLDLIRAIDRWIVTWIDTIRPEAERLDTIGEKGRP